jgi:hypothetical protein
MCWGKRWTLSMLESCCGELAVIGRPMPFASTVLVSAEAR